MEIKRRACTSAVINLTRRVFRIGRGIKSDFGLVKPHSMNCRREGDFPWAPHIASVSECGMAVHFSSHDRELISHLPCTYRNAPSASPLCRFFDLETRFCEADGQTCTVH